MLIKWLSKLCDVLYLMHFNVDYCTKLEAKDDRKVAGNWLKKPFQNEISRIGLYQVAWKESFTVDA